MRECKDTFQNDNDKLCLAKYAQRNSVRYATYITLSDITLYSICVARLDSKSNIQWDRTYIQSFGLCLICRGRRLGEVQIGLTAYDIRQKCSGHSDIV